MRILRHTITLLLATSLAGCASTAQFLQSQPSAHFSSQESVLQQLGSDLQPHLQLRCMKREGNADSPAANNPCLYVSADASALMAARLDLEQRQRLISALTAISDMNCSVFRKRSINPALEQRLVT